MGTLTNGTHVIEWNNPHAPGLDWRKSSRTDLDPILKDCVIVADGGAAQGFPHPSIPDGTHLVVLSDDKDEQGPALTFSRAEFTKFVEGVKAGEFDALLATAEELEQIAALS